MNGVKFYWSLTQRSRSSWTFVDISVGTDKPFSSLRFKAKTWSVSTEKFANCQILWLHDVSRLNFIGYENTWKLSRFLWPNTLVTCSGWISRCPKLPFDFNWFEWISTIPPHQQEWFYRHPYCLMSAVFTENKSVPFSHTVRPLLA